MAFSDGLKLKIRRAAHFRCCLCRNIGVEIHHIIPQENNGPDSEDNAAPLCPACHEIYGANPMKRKFIREARDFWYELCAKKISQSGLSSENLREGLKDIVTKQDLISQMQHFSTLVLSHLKSGNSSKESGDFIPVSVDRFVQTFYREDFGLGYHGFDIFFDAKMWLEDESDSTGLLAARNLFLKNYGERTAKLIYFSECRRIGFDPSAFTEHQFFEMAKNLQVHILLIAMHEQYSVDGLQCALLNNGEIAWRVNAKEGSIVMKNKSKKIKLGR